MLRLTPGRFLPVLFAAACTLVLVASPADAQTGMLKGKVVDKDGKPLDKVAITIEFKDGITRKYDVKSNKKGEFIQIGLPPGNYQATATHEKLGAQSFLEVPKTFEPQLLRHADHRGGGDLRRSSDRRDRAEARHRIILKQHVGDLALGPREGVEARLKAFLDGF